jgi:hypothetical protein
MQTFESFNYPKNRKQDTQTKIMDVFDDIKVSYDDFTVSVEFEKDIAQLTIKIPERLSHKELVSFYEQEIAPKIKQLNAVYGIKSTSSGFFSRTIGNIGSSWIDYKSMQYHRSDNDSRIDIKFHRF